MQFWFDSAGRSWGFISRIQTLEWILFQHRDSSWGLPSKLAEKSQYLWHPADTKHSALQKHYIIIYWWVIFVLSCQFYICTGAFLSFIVRVCRTKSSHLFTQWHQKISIKKYFKYFPMVEKARNPMKLKNKTNSFTSFFIQASKKSSRSRWGFTERYWAGLLSILSAGVQRNRSKCAAHAFMCSRGQFSFLGWIGMISSMTCGIHLCHPVDTELGCPK